MRRPIFSYLKCASIAAVLAIAVITSMHSSTAKNRPMPRVAVVAGVDLTNEERVIGAYFDDFTTYETQRVELSKRATLVASDIEPLGRRSDDLRARLSRVQDTIREIVRKLKAANEWDDLEQDIEGKITDPRLKSFFKQSSFKQLLEDYANNLTSQANEISDPLDKLRKKLTSYYTNGSSGQIVRAAYAEPAPFNRTHLGCGIAKVRVGLAIKAGGSPTAGTAEKVYNRCGPTDRELASE